MANQFQPFDLSNFSDFLDFIPPAEQEIVLALQELIMDCIPHCEMKLSYNVPFYYVNKRICFIWPASVPWGKMKRTGVEFGFCYGYLLRDQLNYLERGNRKQMFCKYFNSLQEIDSNVLRRYLFEAAELDATFQK